MTANLAVQEIKEFSVQLRQNDVCEADSGTEQSVNDSHSAVLYRLEPSQSDRRQDFIQKFKQELLHGPLKVRC